MNNSVLESFIDYCESIDVAEEGIHDTLIRAAKKIYGKKKPEKPESIDPKILKIIEDIADELTDEIDEEFNKRHIDITSDYHEGSGCSVNITFEPDDDIRSKTVDRSINEAVYKAISVIKNKRKEDFSKYKISTRPSRAEAYWIELGCFK